MDTHIADVKKIAVLRATALGDFVAATPALYALRQAYPGAEIMYFGKPWHKTFLEARPSPIDRVIVIPVSHGVREEPHHPHLKENAEELDQFFGQLQSEHFDIAIQLHGGGRNSNKFLLRLNSDLTIGTRTPDAPMLDRWIPYIFHQNEFLRWLEVVKLVGAIPNSTSPFVEVTEEDKRNALKDLPELDKPYVVIHAGASDPRRRWSPGRFAGIADWLIEMGYQVVLTGVGYEQEVVEQIVSHMVHEPINACKRLSLSGLTGLLSEATMLISNDTGPMHLAGAVGCPTVGIFWCINYTNWTHPDRTWNRPLISWTTHCPKCGADITILNPSTIDCDHNACYVEGVSVTEVKDTAHSLLSQMITISGVSK